MVQPSGAPYLEHAAEHNVFSVQVRSLGRRDKEPAGEANV